MSGGITYNGVPGGDGGRIFTGLKFWVAQQVPMRSTILDHIKRNGGVVVALEKDADYLIADHARKNAPSGSISWKFITESAENGFVQMLDHYKIGHAPAGPRQAASGRPTKFGRANFTTAEDAALASWVLAHDSNRTGNELYKEFETTHPRHTWQSWRNRYMKKLQLLPHASLVHLASQASDEPTPQAIEGAQSDQELPDPTALMLQRQGERVQQETAKQRARNRAAAQPPAPSPQPQPQPTKDDDAADTGAKNQLYDDLQEYCQEAGLQFSPTQQIAGQPVELWELLKALSDQKLPAEEIDWLRVAEQLGYAWTDVDVAVSDLQSCYEEKLADFLDTMDLVPTKGGGPASPRNGQMPSSPPTRFTRFLPAKRPLDADDDEEPEIPTPVKRRRLMIPPEVPSTPDVDRRRRPSAGAATTTPVRSETRLPGLHTHESEQDMTPSQQLQSEHLNSSPIRPRFDSRLAPPQSPSASTTANIKRRVLPRDFKSRAPPPPPPQQQSQESPFPGAVISSAQPPPPPPVGPPASVAAARRPLSKEEELEKHIQYCESLGYARATVVEGLRRTTMAPGLATVVMQSLRDGRGVPAHHEGVWTDRDDEGLRLVVGVGPEALETDVRDKEVMKKVRKARRARDRLMDKHGEERMALRIKYLNATGGLAAAAEKSS